MADNHSIGSAYLSVEYKTDKGSADKIKSDIAKAGEAGGKEGGKRGGDELGEGLERGVSQKSIVIGNILANAITAAASKAAEALGDIISTAFEGFGRFEQLEGGVDILFGADASAVLENASRAWQTAGLSANAYMKNVTGFSAGLISSLSGDTAEAARIADMALVDMSDNVNTFGTDMESVQNAYMGLMRGNYTMLDNLSLGFKGTKEGMQDLLAEAERISGRKFEFGNLADEFEAIHIVQESWGILGKTAAEAAGTVEGSLASLGAAWENWLTELGKGDGDIEAVTSNLVEAFGNAAQNVVPLVGRIIGGLIRGLPQLVATAAAELPALLTSIFSAVFGEGVGAGVGEALQSVADGLGPAFADVGAFASEAFAEVEAVLEELQPYIDALLSALLELGGFLADTVLPVIVEIAGTAIVGFIAGVTEAIGFLAAGLGALIELASGAPAAIMGFFSSFEADITGVFESAGTAIENAFQAVVDWFADIPDKIVGFFSDIGSRIAGLFTGIKLPSLHISGSFSPAEWVKGNLPSIEFYASGGIADRATLGVFGEAGPEALVPLTKGRLRPFGESVADAMGGAGTTNVYINGAKVNSSEAIEQSFYDFMRQLSRLNQMGGVAVG